MQKSTYKLFSAMLLGMLTLQACNPASVNPQATASGQNLPAQAAESQASDPAAFVGSGPVRVAGDFKYSNDFVLETYYVEQAVALADMHGFVIRDKEWMTATESQVLGFMNVDYENNQGTFSVDLPVLPRGTMNDVDNNGKEDAGVQIFAVSYWPNYAGGPYSEGDDPTYGWPNYLASVVTDSENDDEVTGGKLLIWSPDANQQFPTDFGGDGKLFSGDDPVAPVPVGYSLVDLDARPFAFSQDTELTATLYEPADLALKDYSTDSYTVAFDKMFDVIRKEYAFNGIEGKAPDWDALYKELAPKVKKAEDDKDPTAFYLAIREYTWAFNDGHVGASGGELENQVYFDAVSTGYGLTVRILDDGRVMVVYVTPGGPADSEGVVPGDVVISKDGEPVMDVIKTIQPLSAPFSTDFSRLYQQARYLFRAPQGTTTTLELENSKEVIRKVTLKAAVEIDSYSFASVYRGFDSNALPVEFTILSSGVGYIKVNSNYDDLNLEYRLFKRALDTFVANEVKTVIIDMRQNSGGAPLGLAGFFFGQEIPLGQLEYYSDETGKFEPDGPREKVRPYQEQYTFEKMGLLVGQACASACEIDAYGLSQVPGMQVFGETPSAGVEAEVARGQFNLPEGIAVQVPTGRFTLPDGSIFLEGKGVQLTYPVPVTAENVLSSGDYVLNTAIRVLTKPAGAGVEPANSPTIAEKDVTEADLRGNTIKYLEDLAAEPAPSSIPLPGAIYQYNVELSASEPLAWTYIWCATSESKLNDNWAATELEFVLNGKKVSAANLAKFDFPSGDQYCKLVAYELTDWPAGEHHLQTNVTYTRKINDGNADYGKGTYTYDYTVYVKP